MSADMNQQTSKLIGALEKPEDMSTEALHSAIQNAKEKMVEWQKEWVRIQRRANSGQHWSEFAEIQRPRFLWASNRWDRVLEKSEELNALLGNFENDRRDGGDTGRASEQASPEGVVAASAARSPGASVAEPPAAAKRPAVRSRIPKELAIDMVDDLAATEATGRGQRVRKPRTFFWEVAAPSKGKRKWATGEEELKTTIALPPSKKRAVSRDVSVVPAGLAASAIHAPPKRAGRAASRTITPAPLPPAKNKRKRAADDDEAATTAPPPTKRRTTSHATSTASPRVTRSATTRAASAVPSRAPSTAPTRTRGPSAPPSAPPAPQNTTGGASSLAPFIVFAPTSTATPLYFLPGFSTPLFSPHAPAPPAILTPAPAPLLPSPEFRVEVPRKRGRPRKGQGAAAGKGKEKATGRVGAEISANEAEAETGTVGKEGKGKQRALDSVEEEVEEEEVDTIKQEAFLIYEDPSDRE